jgi:DNA-binding transcriptional ArsR family regulator
VKAKMIMETHPLLSDKTRLAVMAALITEERNLDFTTLCEHLELSRGNLSSHMTKLENAGLVEIHKEFENKKPLTTYSCTSAGRRAIKEYLENIQFLISHKKAK